MVELSSSCDDHSLLLFSDHSGRSVSNTKLFRGSACFLAASRSFVSAGKKKYLICLILCFFIYLKKGIAYNMLQEMKILASKFQVPCFCSMCNPAIPRSAFSLTSRKKEVKSLLILLKFSLLVLCN